MKLSFINADNEQNYQGIKYVYVDDKNGNHVIKYSMGMAVLYSPPQFFIVAHALAGPLDYNHVIKYSMGMAVLYAPFFLQRTPWPALWINPDGYSEIYHFFIEFSGLFYMLFGFIYLRKLLLLYYSEKITTISIFCYFLWNQLALLFNCRACHEPFLYLFSFFNISLLYY